MTTTARDIFHLMESWAPKNLAYDWDNIGLQIGSSNKKVKKVMVALDVLETVVDEAVEKQADLIIAHHPLLFQSIKQINLDSPKGRTIQKLIQHDIMVYASHTNLDAAAGGVNDMLCEQLGISAEGPLADAASETLYKIAVYVPRTHQEELRQAFHEGGAGQIGNYSHCTFQSPGQGTFQPMEGTNPYIGKQDKLEIVDEVKMESIVPEAKLDSVLEAIESAHPYEEVAFDVYRLENPGETFGLGRIGKLKEAITLEQLCAQVKTAFSLPRVRVTGDLNKKVQKIAVLGGSGEKYASIAKKKGADVYITGDMTFHPAQDAWQAGLPIIDPGHHIEQVMKQQVKNYLDDRLPQKAAEIIVSETNTEPFQFI
ncbi:Nif3-like dinuclear metal center hexameric protein [Lentibacillus sediminis]|uniref:Nif3-like dinuclear metal center hexameric protein n=1 Tax=Lentibacillus sediminis TaxID=1940529 RepID=UPI000C1C7B37|nr:Nif3-like dinuclear metal center hexameric protein [Lentibacillus sediminis]